MNWIRGGELVAKGPEHLETVADPGERVNVASVAGTTRSAKLARDIALGVEADT